MRSNSGFTLIELILVTVIIGILAGAVAISVKGRVTDASTRRAKADIATLESAVDTFALEHQDRYPKSLDELVPKYVKRAPKDPWGNPYYFKDPGQRMKGSFDLFSAGKDGKPGTEDDIGNWDLGEVEQPR
jgi:general secretion pathway protein G